MFSGFWGFVCLLGFLDLFWFRVFLLKYTAMNASQWTRRKGQRYFALTVGLDGHYRCIPTELFFPSIEHRCFHEFNACYHLRANWSLLIHLFLLTQIPVWMPTNNKLFANYHTEALKIWYCSFSSGCEWEVVTSWDVLVNRAVCFICL